MRWENMEGNMQRLKVPGGWIVKSTELVAGYYDNDSVWIKGEKMVAMCFVPDADHSWELSWTSIER
jgi:hypothetical protein